MNARRIAIFTLTAVAAAGGGYALLGLRAPAAGGAPVEPAQASSDAATAGGYYVVQGPDGTTYLVQAPDTLQSDPFASGGFERGERERGEGGHEQETWDD